MNTRTRIKGLRFYLGLLLVGLIIGILPLLVNSLTAKSTSTLSFAGYEWTSRSEAGSPGPNRWSTDNAWTDSEGHLHLAITKSGRRWYCSEVETSERLGFGEYTWTVQGAIGSLDKNVVLGMFNYPTEDVGPDGTHEIDMEVARWGNSSWPNGNFTVWPAEEGLDPAEETFEFTLGSDTGIWSFNWTPTSVTFEVHSISGRELGGWTYSPSDPEARISRQPMPVFMNLWLFGGKAPSNGKAVEIEITGFTFTPYQESEPPEPPLSDFDLALNGVPGTQGWSNEVSKETYRLMALKMMDNGLSMDVTFEVLMSCYLAAVNNWESR